MEFEPKASSRTVAQPPEFAEPTLRKPLVLLRDTERSLRRRTVDTLAPILPETVAMRLGEASVVADVSLEQLAEIDLDEIDDVEMRPARIKIGLMFVGFGALSIVFLLLYLYTLHPELNPIEQVQQHWYPYIGLVSLGVAGMFMLGREAMRPPLHEDR